MFGRRDGKMEGGIRDGSGNDTERKKVFPVLFWPNKKKVIAK